MCLLAPELSSWQIHSPMSRVLKFRIQSLQMFNELLQDIHEIRFSRAKVFELKKNGSE